MTSAYASDADTLKYVPENVKFAGPFTVKQPIVIDSIDNNQTKFNADKLIDTPLSLGITDGVAEQKLADITLEKSTLNLISFGINAVSYIKPEIKVVGAKHFKVFADGKEVNGSASLQPGYHAMAVKFIADSTAIDITLNKVPATVTASGKKRAFTMADNLGARYIYDANISASGRWGIVYSGWYDAENRFQGQRLLIDTKTGQSSQLEKSASWMPRSEKFYYTKKESGKTSLITADPLTGATTTLVADLPSESYYLSPTEDFLILTKTDKGPKKEDGVYEIVHPDDRQPGWRDRTTLSRYDIKTGLVQPLTYTYHSLWIEDISRDGSHAILGMRNDTLTQRPTTRSTFYNLNLNTLEMKMIVEKDGFIGRAMYAGKGSDRVLFKASTEAFNGIGNRVPKGSTPNMFDYHLYLYENGTVKPLTADDRTSIENMDYSEADGNVYYTAQNGDSVSLYRLDMKTLKSSRISQPLEVLNGFCVASQTGDLSVWGSSACVPYQAYKLPKKTMKPALLADPNKDFYADVALGTVHPWQFKCKRGYDVSGFYYLPANFDETKKYPVIVHYYGGCSPTSRRFGNGSHYPAHYWNALGYIVFIVNPSGASGFGQEWASRHVNTMGEGVAQDIIEATEQFAADITQVDKDHIGCVSASYGGFMTQCMMTKTDLFACGISHAGISDHTSYWGEGYWGYSYSEVSAANSYPWTRKDLFVDRSPLYNADKIHKPILFTHGTADTNVPIGESIQMYTALKLLGVPTAFIMVEGENHGIMDPVKRTKWINSMTAWFHKYLQQDSSWWESIYSPKKL